MIKETYLAILKRMKQEHPDAHFEVVTRTAKSILSPSWQLLKTAKENNWSFKTYKHYFLIEMKFSPQAIQRLRELKKLAETKDVYLVCYEKNPKVCHRSILIEIMKGL